jgi:hypothetical protein
VRNVGKKFSQAGVGFGRHHNNQQPPERNLPTTDRNGPTTPGFAVRPPIS